MKTLVEAPAAVQRFADFSTERDAAPATLRAAKELEQVEALLSRRDNLSSTEHAAHCSIHFGPKGLAGLVVALVRRFLWRLSSCVLLLSRAALLYGGSGGALGN